MLVSDLRLPLEHKETQLMFMWKELWPLEFYFLQNFAPWHIYIAVLADSSSIYYLFLIGMINNAW